MLSLSLRRLCRYRLPCTRPRHEISISMPLEGDSDDLQGLSGPTVLASHVGSLTHKSALYGIIQMASRHIRIAFEAIHDWISGHTRPAKRWGGPNAARFIIVH